MYVGRGAPAEGFTPLCAAANAGEEECIKLLLADPRVEVNQATADGSTPLFTAANQGRDGCVKLLLADQRGRGEPGEC